MSMPINAIEALEHLAWALLGRDDTPEPVRRALGRLRASVDQWLGGGDKVEHEELRDGIYVPAHGDWIRLPNGVQLDLRNRRTVRRLAHVLISARLARPGVPIDGGVLVTVTWPSTPAEDVGARRRLQVTLCRLRRGGLGRVLLTKETATGIGWLLDPNVPVVRGRADDRWLAT